MATPVKSVQFKNPRDLLAAYRDQGIPMFAIKQNEDVNFRYLEDNMENGECYLEKCLKLIQQNESIAIYTLAVYEDIPESGLNSKTEPSLKCNFRFAEHNAVGAVEPYQGISPNVLQELKEIRQELNAMKEEQNPPNKLGMIGDLLDNESLQPIIMGVAHKIADWITGPQKMGEIARISGIPESLRSETQVWQGDEKLLQAIDRLYKVVPDLGNVLDKLAAMGEKNPKKLGTYISMLKLMA